MSKAFTKEDDDSGDDLPEIENSIVPGGKNYITPQGAEKLRSEFKELKCKERPEVTRVVSWAAGNGDRSENADYQYGKKRLREIDRRLRFLAKRIESAEVIDPEKITVTYVQFGATVEIEFEDGRQRKYSIVGMDEADVSSGKISWLSPIARALMGTSEGDSVTFSAPGGQQEISVLSVTYVAIPI